MNTLVGLDALAPPPGGAAVTIGTFDGVHLGHRALVAAAIADARRSGATSVALTWDRHPNATLRPERVPPLLTTPQRRNELLGATGIANLAVLAFDDAMSQWPPDRFVKEVLVEGLGARSVVVGQGWRFGHRAAGDVDLLVRLGSEFGFEARALPLVEADGEPVSSSRVRRAVAAGEVGVARTLLGRSFDVDGVVVRGDDRGATLGFPTANLSVEPGLAIPGRGVYGGRARARGTWHKAAINVGVNPTFGGDPATTPPRIEVYLLDFDGDLYGHTVRVEFAVRLRDERAFPSAEALVAQIGRDVEAVRGLGC